MSTQGAADEQASLQIYSIDTVEIDCILCHQSSFPGILAQQTGGQKSWHGYICKDCIASMLDAEDLAHVNQIIQTRMSDWEALSTNDFSAYLFEGTDEHEKLKFFMLWETEDAQIFPKMQEKIATNWYRAALNGAINGMDPEVQSYLSFHGNSRDLVTALRKQAHLTKSLYFINAYLKSRTKKLTFEETIEFKKKLDELASRD